MYDITYQFDDRLLLVTMAGLWTVEEAQQFGGEVLESIRDAAALHRDFVMLTDSTNFPVQNPAVTGELGHFMEVAETMMTGRRAVAVGSMLNKLQATRALAHSSVRIFLSIDEARQWLAAAPDSVE